MITNLTKTYGSLSAALILACVLGYTVGRIVSIRIAIAEIPTTIRSDERPLVPVVSIDGVSDGLLYGSMLGNVRFFAKKDQVFAGTGGLFAIDPGSLLQDISKTSVPSGMEFVASRRGKKYYSVRSGGGESIIAKNRVYFRTAEDAEAAGYLR